MKKMIILLRLSFFLWVALLLFSRSNVLELERSERVRAYTRPYEFDYVSWTLQAFDTKWQQAALSTSSFLNQEQQVKTVKSCVKLTGELNQVEDQIEKVYTDPSITQPKLASAALVKQRDILNRQEDDLQPLCESILQQQVSLVLNDAGLTVAGQPIPPLLYRVTPLPMALITSPRQEISQEQNISLFADLKIEDITRLENNIETGLDVSALVVPIGGVGVYPTMVLSSEDLSWQIETISHEWTHNYLTLRPLGVNYDTTPELRTMNETTASIVGGEVGKEVLRRFYPELLPQPEPEKPAQDEKNSTPTDTPQKEEPPAFNFNKEMHLTRVHTDELLKAGKIKEAEDYMEARRHIFWDHGYQIRRLNQAYFAFYGAYADTPAGAAGNDPVGPAVVKLRQNSRSLADFLNRISWMSSFDQLQKTVQ